MDACVRLAKTWRNSREYRNSYVDLANRIDLELPSISAIADGLRLAPQHEKNGNQEVREVGPISVESTWERAASGETLLSLEKGLLAFAE